MKPKIKRILFLLFSSCHQSSHWWSFSFSMNWKERVFFTLNLTKKKKWLFFWEKGDVIQESLWEKVFYSFMFCFKSENVLLLQEGFFCNDEILLRTKGFGLNSMQKVSYNKRQILMSLNWSNSVSELRLTFHFVCCLSALMHK